MKTYIITFERNYQKKYNGTWGVPQLSSKSNYYVCTSKKKAEKYLEYCKGEATDWDERFFPFSHITRTWISGEYRFRDIYMIEEWEL